MVKEIPTGVKVISIFYYIGAAFATIGGILFLVSTAFMSTLFTSIIPTTLGSGLFIFAGIIILAFGILDFFIAKGLWNVKKWARILVIVLSCLVVLTGLTSISSIVSVISIVISGLIGGYLIFSKKVKAAFK